jgi:hypothetical protein
VKRHHQRQFEGAGERQCECTATTEMRMDDPWTQQSEIRNRRNMAELLEQEPVDRTDGAAPPEEDRLNPQIG